MAIPKRNTRTDAVVLQPVTKGPYAHPWWRFAEFPYRKDWVRALGKEGMPGPRWDPTREGWYIPTNCIPALPFKCMEAKFYDKAESITLTPKKVGAPFHKLQRSTALRAAVERRHLFAWDAGTGKTAGAIATVGAAGIRDGVFVLCPAAAMEEWEEQWPVWDMMGGDRDATTIVSYDDKKMIAAITSGGFGPINALIMDESHHVMNKTTKRYARIAGLRARINDDALILLLSGTPISNQLYNLHTQLDLMEPGAWGSWSGFCKRYMLYAPNDYATSGVEYFGMNPENAEELSVRLNTVCTRVTDRDVGIKAKLKIKRKEIEPGEKVAEALAWTKKARGPRLIYTHRIESAHVIAHAVNGACITGKMPRKKRRAMIDQCVADGTVMVATMHSVGESINNLAQVPNLLFAELWWSPRVIMQAIKRVHRFTTKKNVTVTFNIGVGTIDEAIVENLAPKLEGIDEVLKPGSVTLDKLVNDVDLTDANFRRRLSEEAGGLEDPYGF